MLGLTSLEVYNSIFKITEEDNKFKLYKFPDEKTGGVSYEKVRGEIETNLDISDITATDIQDEVIAPIIFKEFREQVTKRMKDDQYVLILSIYVSSIFQDFESFLRTEIDLVEDDIRMVLYEYISKFVNYKLQPDIYTFKDLSEALFKIFQPEHELFNNSIDTELDDITKNTKIVCKIWYYSFKIWWKIVFLLLSWISNNIGIINIIMITLAREF